MYNEVEVPDFFYVWAKNRECSTDEILLYNPDNEAEFSVRAVNNDSIEVLDKNKIARTFPRRGVSSWFFLIPGDHVFQDLLDETKTPAAERRELIKWLQSNSIPVVYMQSLEDLRLIKWAWTTPFSQTDRNSRHQFYSAVKKLENFPEHRGMSFKIGRQIVEKWVDGIEEKLPADLLVHLAYYRRWSGDTNGALAATDCLTGPRLRRDISDEQRSILATERAAAFMDQYERCGTGLEEADRFLRYSMGATQGRNSPENLLAWQRYNKLKEVS